jgi:galactose-1-phosphate uridylyltransferase
MEVSEEQKTKAQRAIQELLEQMGVERVVCIDDLYAHETKLEDVTGLIRSQDSEAVRTIPDLRTMSHDDEDITIERLRQQWDQLGEATQKKYIAVF